MRNPEILKFMDKVTCQTYPAGSEESPKVPMAARARVEVITRGQTFTEELGHRHGVAGTEGAWTDKEVVAKFRHNAARVLTQDKIDRAVKALLELEKVEDIAQLMREVTL